MTMKCPSCGHICQVDENTVEYTCPNCGEEITLHTQDTTKKTEHFIICQNCFVKIQHEALSPFDTFYCPMCGAEIEQ